MHKTFSYLTVNSDFYVACSNNDVTRVSLLCFFCASLQGVCVVVIYCKYRRAKSHPQNKSPKMRTNHFSAHPTTIKPFTFPSACDASHHHSTRPHRLGMGRDVGRSPPEHPEQAPTTLKLSLMMSLERTSPCAMILSSSTRTTSNQASRDFVCLHAVQPIQMTR